MTPNAKHLSWFSAAGTVVLAGLLAGCSGGQQTPAKSPTRSLGVEPGDVYTLAECKLDADKVCNIEISAKPPSNTEPGKCTMKLMDAAILPVGIEKLAWTLKSGTDGYRFQFREGKNDFGSGFGILLIDDMRYDSTTKENAPIWAFSASAPASATMTRNRPPPAIPEKKIPMRISAYDILVEYRGPTDREWLPCNNYDPMIINRE